MNRRRLLVAAGQLAATVLVVVVGLATRGQADIAHTVSAVLTAAVVVPTVVAVVGWVVFQAVGEWRYRTDRLGHRERS